MGQDKWRRRSVHTGPLDMLDNDMMRWGNAQDATLEWDGTNLELLPKTDDTGSFNIGNGTLDFDHKIFLGAAGVYALFDVGNSRFSLVGVDLATDAPVVITDATESTSTSTGALIVSGGIANAKDTYLGDDLFLTSAAKIDWAAGNALLTHSTGLLTFSASNVAFGVDATGIDVSFFGDTASYKVWWDQNGDTNGAWYFGADDYGVDVEFFGQTASAYALWDASADQLRLAGGASLNYYVGAAPTNHTPISVGRFVASAASGGGFAVTSANSAAGRFYAEETADLTSAAMVRALMGRFLITGAITSNAECFGVVGQLVANGATVQHDNAGVMGTFESQTTAVTISGTGGDHVVAAVMGRVGVSITATTVNTDGILAGVAAMSNITDGFVTVNGSGILAAFYAGQFSSKQDWDVGFHNAVSSATKAADLNGVANGLYVTATALTADSGRIGKFYGTMAAPNMADGYGAFEVDITLSGTMGATGFANASSSWVNIPTGTVGAGKYVCARNDGVYEATAATITNAKIVFGARMHKLLDDTDALSFPFSLNTNNTAITALFDCNNITDFGTVANAGATAATLVPFMRDAGGTLKYVLLYDLA